MPEFVKLSIAVTNCLTASGDRVFKTYQLSLVFPQAYVQLQLTLSGTTYETEKAFRYMLIRLVLHKEQCWIQPY